MTKSVVPACVVFDTGTMWSMLSREIYTHSGECFKLEWWHHFWKDVTERDYPVGETCKCGRVVFTENYPYA